MKYILYFHFLILFLLLYTQSVVAETKGELKQDVLPFIEKHIQFVTKINCLKTHKITFSGIHFNNIVLIECLYEIEKQQSFIPLVDCWQKLKKMPELEIAIIGQFSIILLFAYHFSLGCYTEPNRLAWLSLISLYAQLNMIPLKKLFDALDECLQQYQIIIENFPKEKGESWNSWLEKNWVVPLAIIAFTFYSFINWHNGHSSPKYMF